MNVETHMKEPRTDERTSLDNEMPWVWTHFCFVYLPFHHQCEYRLETLRPDDRGTKLLIYPNSI